MGDHRLLKLGRVLPAFVLIILIGAVFLEFLGPDALLLSHPDGDVASLYYYWRDFSSSSLSRGVVPLWNPDVLIGVPFAAYPEAAVFYPPNLMFLLVPIAWALNLSFVLHLALLAVFEYLFLRRLGLGRSPAFLGAAALTFSAPVVLHVYAGHLSNICTMAWIPALFWLSDRAARSSRFHWIVLLGAAGAAAILAGHWQYLYYGLLWIFFFQLVALPPQFLLPGLGRLVLAALLAAGLAAPQLLISLDLAPEAFRSGLGFEWAANFSLPPVNLLTFLSPEFFGDSLSGMYWGRFIFWEMNAYLGVLPLLLAVISLVLRRDRLAWGTLILAALAVLFSLGSFTPVFGFLYRYVPGFSFLRGSSKTIFFAVFFLVLLAARGADLLSRRSLPRPFAAGLALLGLLLAAFLLGQARPPEGWKGLVEAELLRGRHHEFIPPGQPEWWEELADEHSPLDWGGYVSALTADPRFIEPLWSLTRVGLGRWAAVLFVFGVILGLIRRRVPLLLAILAALELGAWARGYAVGFNPGSCRWEPALASFLATRRRPFRYASFDPRDYNRGMLRGFPCLTGHQADAPRRNLEYLAAGQYGDPGLADLSLEITTWSPLFALANLRYYILPAGSEITFPRLKLAVAGADREIWEMEAQPRVICSRRALVLDSPREILRRLASPTFAPADAVFLEEPLPEWFSASPSPPGVVEKIVYSPNRLEVEAALPASGILLVNDAYAPGWLASVDGRPARIYRANYLMRAVVLPAGRHRVVFSYRPRGWVRGMIVLLIAVSGLLSAWIIWGRSRPFRERFPG